MSRLDELLGLSMRPGLAAGTSMTQVFSTTVVLAALRGAVLPVPSFRSRETLSHNGPGSPPSCFLRTRMNRHRERTAAPVPERQPDQPPPTSSQPPGSTQATVEFSSCYLLLVRAPPFQSHFMSKMCQHEMSARETANKSCQMALGSRSFDLR